MVSFRPLRLLLLLVWMEGCLTVGGWCWEVWGWASCGWCCFGAVVVVAWMRWVMRRHLGRGFGGGWLCEWSDYHVLLLLLLLLLLLWKELCIAVCDVGGVLLLMLMQLLLLM